MLTYLEVRVLQVLGRAKRSNVVHDLVNAQDITEMNMLRSMLYRGLVVAVHVDGFDPEDLASWRWYITAKGREILARVK